jgi:hypothetical protein
VAGNLDNSNLEQSKSKPSMFTNDPEVYYSQEGLTKLQRDTSKKNIAVDEPKQPVSKIDSFRPARPLATEAMADIAMPQPSELKQIIEEVIEVKFDAMKREIIEALRTDQRNMHIELIRQFEIQKDILTEMLDAKAKENNQMFLEYQKAKEDLEAIRRHTF